jgi:hypothetical protein
MPKLSIRATGLLVPFQPSSPLRDLHDPESTLAETFARVLGNTLERY